LAIEVLFNGLPLDQAEQNEANGRKGSAKWSKPKHVYNRMVSMVSMLLTTRIPLIFSNRAKQPIKIEMKRKNDGSQVEVWTPSRGSRSRPRAQIRHDCGVAHDLARGVRDRPRAGEMPGRSPSLVSRRKTGRLRPVA
jgi:hypothetical protein